MGTMVVGAGGGEVGEVVAGEPAVAAVVAGLAISRLTRLLAVDADAELPTSIPLPRKAFKRSAMDPPASLSTGGDDLACQHASGPLPRVRRTCAPKHPPPS